MERQEKREQRPVIERARRSSPSGKMEERRPKNEGESGRWRRSQAGRERESAARACWWSASLRGRAGGRARPQVEAGAPHRRKHTGESGSATAPIQDAQWPQMVPQSPIPHPLSLSPSLPPPPPPPRGTTKRVCPINDPAAQTCIVAPPPGRGCTSTSTVVRRRNLVAWGTPRRKKGSRPTVDISPRVAWCRACCYTFLGHFRLQRLVDYRFRDYAGLGLYMMTVHVSNACSWTSPGSRCSPRAVHRTRKVHHTRAYEYTLAVDDAHLRNTYTPPPSPTPRTSH